MNLFELTHARNQAGGYKNRNKKRQDWRTNVVLQDAKGGVLLDSNKTRDRL